MILDQPAKTSDRQQLTALLYAGIAPDTQAQLDAAANAALVAGALDLMTDRRSGGPKIRTRSLTVTTAAGHAEPVTLVEVLNDDMPFLVDSVIGEVQARGFNVRLVLHPILKVSRDGDGRLQELLGPGDKNWGDGRQESLIILLLDELNPAGATALSDALAATLGDVRIAVADWQTMLSRFDRTIIGLESNPPPIAPGLLSETLAFCRWLRDGHFTFLGAREYRLQGDAATGEPVPVPETGLGVLRDPSIHVLSRDGDALAITPEIRRFLFTPQPLIIAKSDIMSRIHRRAQMDYVGVKTYAKDGRLSGELRIVGLFTSQAYTQPAGRIPFLRHKVEHVVSQSGFASGSHASKSLSNVLETFPRDELFQIGEGQLLDWARGIVDLELRPRVRLFVRRDRFDRYVSALVYAQRDRFSTAVRERISTLLAEAYDGQVSGFTPFFPEGPLVRVHFVVSRNSGPPPAVDLSELERLITEATRTWDDQLTAAITSAGQSLSSLVPRYGKAFSTGYAETFSASRAVEDIARIERLSSDRPVAIDFYREPKDPPGRVRGAVYRYDTPIPLSDRVPVLENLGFSVIDERSYRVHPQLDGGPREVALHDMMLETADGAPLDLTGVDVRMEDCYLAVHRGLADNDAFNRLVVIAGATWRDVTIVRALAAYMRQIRLPFGPRYIADTLNRHAGMARDLIELFHVRFDPARKGSADERSLAEGRIKHRIEGALAQVQALDEDRILRSYLNLISATLRTNFFQEHGQGQSPETLSFKLDSKLVEGSPAPRPFREIWVYSPRVEGIHLRFAAIARGGIRWSDRAQDFRTEVLDLCKAQHVKNTVIVPAGSKGGFLPKLLPRHGNRDDVMKEGVAAYRIFISSLLDVTDNIRDGVVVPPPNVVRHESDDPYLVVAADKGTATFSDFANNIAIERGFWLGDAFASGGSAGYDHKKMGITARGAWECVKRHFREIDVDIQTTPFRVIGVGDMSGDVFGNGMLLSPAILLLAAFDHRDIFIDPNPDAAASFAERRRMFDLPRSSWQDYDKAKISTGGGVFPRSSKSISLSDRVRTLLGVASATMTPAELINAILKCETDLLWFGGIGTYVRATAETDEQAGDRNNDAVRVAASELRARVVGEGANLGLTQRGRMEFASRGGRLNTDFIDNSAGVNSSDQEVNIKIAIGPAVASGRLPAAERTAFLSSMTEDVAAACLVNNIHQALAISLTERRSGRDLGFLARLMNSLEARGVLSRKLEALPTNGELRVRETSGLGLTRPEIAVILSHAKIALDHDLLASSVPDNPACQEFLTGYFPAALRERFPDDVKAHQLRREIITTFIVNGMINRGGPAFAVRLADETGRSAADIAYAFLAVRSFLDLSPLWSELHAAGTKIPGQLQLDLYGRTQDAILEQAVEVLRAGPVADVGTVIVQNRQTMESLVASFDSVMTPRQRSLQVDTIARLSAAGVPTPMASKLGLMEMMGSVPALTRLAGETGQPVAEVARVGFAAAEHLRVAELKARAAGLKVSDYYDRLAISSAISTLDAASRALTRDVFKSVDAGPPDFSAWEKAKGARFAQVKAGLDDIASSGDLSVSRLTVAAAQVRDLAAG